jgi:hypothetical protein
MAHRRASLRLVTCWPKAKHETGAERAWQVEDAAQQRRFLIARARGLTDYAIGPLPQQYQAQRAGLARSAIEHWEAIIADGQDEAAVAEGRQRLPELEKLASSPSK